MMAREGSCEELESEDVCNQCPSDTHTEEEAIRSVDPKLTTNHVTSKSFFKPYFIQ